MAEYSSYDDLQIGASAGSLTALGDLLYGGENAGVQPPKTFFREAAEFRSLANGGVRGLGAPIIVWRFESGLPVNARRALRAFISGASGTVYIQSPDKNGDLQIYETVMQWPQEPIGYQAFDHTAPFEIAFARSIEQ